MATGFAGQGGKFGGNTVGFAGGAVSDIFGAQATAGGLKLKAKGDLAEAGNYDLAAGLARENATFTETSTAVQQHQMDRTLYQAIGTETADIAGAGLSASGSALDLLRNSAEQGALTKAVGQQQGIITEDAYKEQAQSYDTMASAARMAASEETKQASAALRNGWISGGIKAASSIATLA